MSFQQHPQAIVETSRVGPGTRIRAFAHIFRGASIGENCDVCDYVLVENDVVVGDRVTIKSGVQLVDGLRIEDDVLIGPNATFTNDKFPRSQVPLETSLLTVVRRGASIGANATILPGLVIGERAMVGAGAVVTRTVPPNAIVVGNPARIVGYVDSSVKSVQPVVSVSESTVGNRIPGVRVVVVPRVRDLRGELSVVEFEQHLPFIPRRYFVVFNVPTAEVRGEHAHRSLEQFLVCLRGSCSVMVDDGRHREEITLDRPEIGVYVPPMVWSVQYKYSADALLLVLASAPYDPADYIRDYGEFIRLQEPPARDTSDAVAVHGIPRAPRYD